MSGDTVDVVVPSTDLADDQRAQIEDIIKRKTGVSVENIVITPWAGKNRKAGRGRLERSIFRRPLFLRAAATESCPPVFSVLEYYGFLRKPEC